MPRAPPETTGRRAAAALAPDLLGEGGAGFINVARADDRHAAPAQQLGVARAEQDRRRLVLQRVAQLLRVQFVHAGDGPQAAREEPFEFQRQAARAVQQAGDAFGVAREDGQVLGQLIGRAAMECGGLLQRGVVDLPRQFVPLGQGERGWSRSPPPSSGSAKAEHSASTTSPSSLR